MASRAKGELLKVNEMGVQFEQETWTGGSPNGDHSRLATAGFPWITRPAAAPANFKYDMLIRMPQLGLAFRF
jgi:hypothetical protein